MNNFKLYIFDPYMSEGIIAETSYRIPGTFEEVEASVVFPLGIGDFLDERLDEAYITVYNSEVQHYKAKAICKVEIYEDNEVAATKYYIVGNDNSIELPVGSGKYKHDLFLIEPTKLLEGIVCQSLTFTNALDNRSKYNYAVVNTKSDWIEEVLAKGALLSLPTPVSAKKITLPSLNRISDVILNLKASGSDYEVVSGFTGNDGKNYESFISVTIDQSYVIYNNLDQSVDIGSGFDEAIIAYSLCFNRKGSSYYTHQSFSYMITTKEVFVKKPYTITEMVQRCLELAYPICKSDSHMSLAPMFSFDGVTYKFNKGGAFGDPIYNDGSQSSIYNEQIATELTLTQGTLREQLKAIGNLIHSEPRVIVVDTGNKSEGKYTTTIGFSIVYDSYDKGTNANIPTTKPYVYRSLSQSINEYCDCIRTNAKNIVNSIDYGQGTLVDPMSSKNENQVGTFRSIRSETLNMRIGASNGVCKTSMPIYDIIKVECGVISQSNWESWATEYAYGGNTKYFDGTPVDITPFVFEKSTYDTLDGFSHTGKALAIYYTRGQKNIGGLFFKRAQISISQAYGEFAIANILNTIKGQSIGFDDVVKVAFKITYIPMYNTAFDHGKQNFSVKELFEPRYTIPYNQSENIIEARYYGENVKGAAARLGNIEQERTYIFDKLSEIPKNGQVVDGYTICASNTQMLPTHYKTTLALSKDFNRINQYVGVSQNKRTFEISEREAYERNVVISGKVVIQESSNTYYLPRYTLQSSNVLQLMPRFNEKDKRPSVITAVVARGYDKDGTELNPIILPVVSSAFGNNISFGWEYKDNYSAGDNIEYYKDDDVSGYWGKDVPYCNDYGNIYKYRFGLVNEPEVVDATLSELEYKIPSCDSNTFGSLYNNSTLKIDEYLLRKDSREKIAFNVNIEYVTSDPELIVGSALASSCQLVSYEQQKPVVFAALNKPIGKFETSLAEWGTDDYKIYTDAITYTSGSNTVRFTHYDFAGASNKYVAWAVVTPSDKITETYINEAGEKVKITREKGLKILFGKNKSPRNDIMAFKFVFTS